MKDIRLHSYFRSSTSTRVRTALALKGLTYDYIGWDLRKGDQHSDEFLAINPQGLVPALEIDGIVLNQSVPIIEYLDERFPEPPLLPQDAAGRARVRALAAMIACEVHPLNNLRVLRYLGRAFGADADAQAAWFAHWAQTTLSAMEQMLAGDGRTGDFCHGNQPGLADICLYAQMLNNRRFDIDGAQWPTLARIFAACSALPAFAQAAPETQPDAVPA